MSRERLVTKRMNVFDGQRVTEADLDTEQISNNTLIANIALDFHGSGVYNNSPFTSRILLNTSLPGTYVSTGSVNPSKSDIEAGNYDGKGISLDRQPSDTVRGNRIEFSLVNSSALGRDKVKVLILGRKFNGLNTQGELVAEFIEFGENTSKITKHYYLEIISVLFNNFSGGTGRTQLSAAATSQDLITSNSGYMLIQEAEPLKVYPFTEVVTQTESPNIDLSNFITSSASRTIEQEIALALGASNTISDLYIEMDGQETITFAVNGSSSVAYGQKFLSQVNNIQRIDLLLSVTRDTARAVGNQFDFSGDIVLSIYELATEISCPSDAVPDDLIDYDPEITPLVEISFDQADLATLGIQLNATPQVVPFNFAGTLVADPNIEPSIESNKYYAFMVSRRGDSRTGTIVMQKGYDKVYGKELDSIDLNPLEQYGKRTTKFVEFDPTTKRYVSDSQSSLWFKIYSDAVEITNGTAYADTGKAITIPKTVEYIGNVEISNFERNITFRTVAENASNYVILSHEQEFSTPGTHPRTGNFLFTRIIDGTRLAVVNSSELTDIQEDTEPLILARLNDTNVRDAQSITGTFDKPGLVGTNTIMLVDPPSSLLAANLINRTITPDTNCDCSSTYRIVGVTCNIIRPGDFDDSGTYTASDISSLLENVGETINSEPTERSIFGGALDILDFIRSDLDDNETVDGTDIELLEDAVDGYVNFTVAQEIKVLTLQLENVLEADDYPTIFTDTGAGGTTTAGTATLEFVTDTENQALMIRLGDQVTIEAASTDAGTYKIATKTINIDGITVTVTVTDLDDAAVTFNGDTTFDVTVVSGTKVNVMADNPNIVNIPFVGTAYEISFIEAPFEEQFINVCDLRRYTPANFIELATTNSCECASTPCLPANTCAPQYKNQSYIPNDLFLVNGELLESPGVPYHGDYEYANITIPLPAGDIEDCSIDLYNTFVKGVGTTCLTAAGYPAMKYSDGTYVGCEDSGSSTDITKGRVKFSKAIASIYVDAVATTSDGYTDLSTAVDSDTDSTEVISENFIDDTFTTFNAWTDNPLNNIVITNISHPAGNNQPAIFDLTTTVNSGERFGRLDAPVATQDFDGDFIIDFRATRTVWPEASLTSGQVSSFLRLVISNTDGSEATLKFGWRVVGGQSTYLFYEGTIENALGVVTSTFDYQVVAPDSVGDEVLFRLRRVNDVVSAYYILPDAVDESTADTFGQYVRIGSNPDQQPGEGSVDVSFEINQISSPNAGITFFSRLSEIIILSEYTAVEAGTSLSIGRDAATDEVDRATVTFPFDLSRRTSIVSASLSMTAASAGNITDTFNIYPLDILNADNLGTIFNYPAEENTSVMVSFSPGSIDIGDTIEVDVSIVALSLLGNAGHLPGYLKALIIEPDVTADSTFSILSDMTLTVTYLDASTGVVFQIGMALNHTTGIATLITKNILYDAINEANRTVLNFGVYLKKAGFANQDVAISINDLARLGIGSCSDASEYDPEEECFFIVGATATGSFVEGPFPCIAHLP